MDRFQLESALDFDGPLVFGLPEIRVARFGARWMNTCGLASTRRLICGSQTIGPLAFGCSPGGGGGKNEGKRAKAPQARGSRVIGADQLINGLTCARGLKK